MPPPRDDHTLLRAYVERKDESAFAELVARHADMVYGSAVRQVGRGGMAEDVAQATFILLARKAGQISERVVVAAWLHKATRYAALNAVKIQRRRRVHEQRAGELVATEKTKAASTSSTSITWAAGSALLDEGVARLGRKDRDAVILRFLERRSFADVGDIMGVSEEAAQMRVRRAIDKLRDFFQRRGLVLSAVTLRAHVSANAVTQAPVAFKSGLAHAACEAAREGAGNAAVHAIATSTAHSMTLATLRSTSAIIGSALATAAVVAMLLNAAVSRWTESPRPVTDAATTAASESHSQSTDAHDDFATSRAALLDPLGHRVAQVASLRWQ